MTNIRSSNQIILDLIDFFKLVQPDLDTKPGTTTRDLLIEAPASQLSLLYDELSSISGKQSLRLVIGSDLDKLSKNFGVIRKQSTSSTGVGLLTFSAITAPINVDKGDIIIANNGLSFTVVNGISVVPASLNYYKSVASKFRDQLDIAGISDTLAVEITVSASTAGTAGNIGKFSLDRTNISGVSNVTNINAFSGGTDQESDPVFRNRVLSSFSGSSVGTALGYQNAALATTGVLDAFVVEPGNALMTRDGTITTTASDGSHTIVTEGSGGKVDVVILGSNLQQNTDSFIYKDKSNSNDPTNSKNDFVLGQISGDENKTINRKRIDNLKNEQLPEQPVSEILQVSGSISGSNFLSKTTDSLGRVSGNYDLIKDTGVYSGSPWGFDTFHWISRKISLFEDDRVKGQSNGQDATTFTDILEIPSIQQNISISNENSTVTSDRSIIQLLHTPATNVTRVFNVNTGERYIITNQNIDNTALFNTTGRIQISGNTFPSPSDVLQVDYNWVVFYDQYSDYDGLKSTSNPRDVTDSIDWGYSFVVRDELINLNINTGNNFFIGTSSNQISTVISANKSTEIDGVVEKITSGIFVNRMAVTISNLSTITNTVDSIKTKNTNIEQYNTAEANGSFTSVSTVVGINVLYITTIILPTDCSAVADDRLTVLLDSKDVFNATTSTGSVSGTQITIPTSQIDTTATSITLRVSYIASPLDLYSSGTTSLPASRFGNGFITSNNNGFTNFSQANISRRESVAVQKNFSNQFYVELNLLASDYSISTNQVLSIVRLSDGSELWNPDNVGTIAVGTSGNYQLILDGYHSPSTFDKALVVYYAYDLKRFQPFSYQNTIIKYNINTLSIDPGTGKFYVPINNFINETGVFFKIIEPNTDIVLFNITDGYLVNDGATAIVGSATVNFSTLPDLINKKIKIFKSNSFNNGIFDIIEYNVDNNTFVISSSINNNIDFNQISIVRLLDGKEIWNSDGVIDIDNNKLLLSSSAVAINNDYVIVLFFKYSNLKQSLTKLSSTTVDQSTNVGIATFSGTTLTKATDIIFTATTTGLKLNLNEALRKALNISSTSSIPSNIKIGRIVKLEKVITASISSDDVISVLATYDIKNTTIKNNLFYLNECLFDNSLQNLEFILPSTKNNMLNDADSQNLPKLGDKLRVTFYYINDSDSENLSYTRNGTLYTNKKFAFINKVFVNSGFRSSQATKLTLTSFTQPNLGSRYKAFYDYTAPKQNERIVIVYNFDKLVSDTTLNIENTRPINADVLIRSGKNIQIDLTMNVVISDDFKLSTTTIIQNLKDKLTTSLTATVLGDVIDQITLINVAQGVTGIARARILVFNKAGSLGQVLKIQMQDDEYFSLNNLIVNTETR